MAPLKSERVTASDEPANSPLESGLLRQNEQMICPLCGSAVVQEKCKILCRSEICRGRVIMNCSEF